MPANCLSALLITGTLVITAVLAIALEFQSIHQGSLTAPADYRSQPGRSIIECSSLCTAAASVCFGFYWLQDLCHLFNASALFQNQTWVSTSEQCNVFTGKFPIQRAAFNACNQSSYYDITRGCNKAIDGNRDPDYFKGYCSHTENFLPSQWWEGQLSSPSVLAFVQIYNRQDCCTDRFNEFSLLLDGVQCNRVSLATPFLIANFTCVGFGSRVRVLNQQSQSVILCEIEVYALVY